MVEKISRTLTLGERASNWAKAISLLGAALLGFYGAFLRGEPEAQLAYKELAKAFNQLKQQVDKEHAYVHGFLAGLNQGSLGAKVDEPVKPEPAKAPVVKVSPKSCKPGWISSKGKCLRAKLAVKMHKPQMSPKIRVVAAPTVDKIKVYIKKNMNSWSVEQKADAFKLYQMANKGNWDLARFINALMQVQRDRDTKKPLLPPTLTKLKAAREQPQVQAQEPPK